MFKIIINLPLNRNYLGELRLEDPNGNIIIDGLPVVGKSDRQLAENPNLRKRFLDRQFPPNPSRNPLLPYGDTPLGTYKVKDIHITGAGTIYSEKCYGASGLVELQPLSGQALEAAKNGRTRLAIHGGKLSENGNLRATNGCIRLLEEDMQTLIIALEEVSSNILCFCAESKLLIQQSDLIIESEDKYDECDPFPIQYEESYAYSAEVVKQNTPLRSNNNLDEIGSSILNLNNKKYTETENHKKFLKKFSARLIDGLVRYLVKRQNKSIEKSTFENSVQEILQKKNLPFSHIEVMSEILYLSQGRLLFLQKTIELAKPPEENFIVNGTNPMQWRLKKLSESLKETLKIIRAKGNF